MCSRLLLVGSAILFASAPVAAQPAALAPLSDHVRYLISQAADTFRVVRGAPLQSGVWQSRHLLPGSLPSGERERGTIIQVVGGTEGQVRFIAQVDRRTAPAADSAVRRLAGELRRAVPGWAERPGPEGRGFTWTECPQTGARGRMVGLLQRQQPDGQVMFGVLIRAAASPCPSSAGPTPVTATAPYAPADTAAFDPLFWTQVEMTEYGIEYIDVRGAVADGQLVRAWHLVLRGAGVRTAAGVPYNEVRTLYEYDCGRGARRRLAVDLRNDNRPVETRAAPGPWTVIEEETLQEDMLFLVCRRERQGTW